MGGKDPHHRDAGRGLNELEAGSVVGPYTLTELLGVGGMGSVWLAAQSMPVRREVALKSHAA